MRQWAAFGSPVCLSSVGLNVSIEVMKDDQKAALLECLKTFLADPNTTNEGESEKFSSFDQKRIAALPALNELIKNFLSGKIDLQRFKDEHGSKCRELPYWGFKGTSGQMQVNQLAKNIEEADRVRIFRNAVKVPVTEDEAKEKIDALVRYIAEKRSSSPNPRSLPRPVSVKYMLSYFWEIQDHTKWPVCYNSSKRVLDEIGFSWGAELTEGESYLYFLSLMREIKQFFIERNIGDQIKYPYWFVEHVLWKRFLTSNTRTGVEKKSPPDGEIKTSKAIAAIETSNEWLPPVIADLGELALDRETAWSKRHNLKPEKAFETKLNIAFTLLGYEATELGQGRGRQPDGLAISINVPGGDYAIVYDAKAREKHFKVGTSDREMHEYIMKKVDELKERRVHKSYFLVVSSEFDSSATNINLIKSVYKRTRIPIVMMKAVDLLFLIEEKLKNTELTHQFLEDLFLDTGILTREKIVDTLGIR